MMEALAQLHFLRPQMLWALLALLPLAWWWRRRAQRANVWRGIVDPHLLPHLMEGQDRQRAWPAVLAALALVIAIVALAGPSWRKGEQALWEPRAPLIVALDLSTATNAGDLPPSRLLQARSKLATLLRDRQGGQVGLIAYAGDAFTVAPLTDDADNVALFLDALSPEVMPLDGQRADRAIELSVQLLKQAAFVRGDILLITDHADSAALAAAAAANAQGFRVSALGLGSETGSAYRRIDGSLDRARLDASSLRALATRGGGRYATVARESDDLVSLGVLDPQSAGADSGGNAQRTVRLDDGYWLLLPLMLLALLAFRRGAAPWVVVACALLWTTPSQAAERDWWQRADQKDHARMESGVDAYRRGDYAKAEHSFEGQRSADALYNQGNALAKQGRYDEAIAAYDAALSKQPGMPDAIANRAAVERARKQSDSQGQGSGQSGANQNNANASQGSNRAGSPPPSSNGQKAPPQPNAPQRNDAQAQTPPAGAPPQPSKQPAQPPTSPADAKAQQSADAAQRQRMQEALAKQRQQQQRGAAKQPVPANETPEQRERRQALEAWLKRVPDDPGGLLKTKFQLEYERRAREGQ